MIKHIVWLVRLQRVDIEIKGLIDERTHACEPYEKQKHEHETKSALLEEKEQVFAELKQKLESLDATLKAEKEKVKKWDTRLKTIRSARDYAAMQREIETQKRLNTEMEEEQLKLMEEEEKQKVEIEGLKKSLDELATLVEQEKSVKDSKVVGIDAKIATLQKERREIIPNLPQDVLRRYDAVRERRQGIAIAELVNDRCMVCHMSIPPQLSNMVQTGQTLESCPSCNRFLYFKPLLDKEMGGEEK